MAKLAPGQEDAYPDGCDRGGAHRCPRGAAPAVRGWNRAHATERFEPSPSRRCAHSVAALRSATAESAEESQVLTESSTLPPMERAGLWPPNDPDFKNCLRNGNGIRLAWQSTKRAKPIYLMVMQRQGDGEWETWVEKTPVSGVAFTLALRSAQARNSEFQWVLFQSQSNIPQESNYFCTRG